MRGELMFSRQSAMRKGYFARGVLITLSLSLPRLSCLSQKLLGLNGFLGCPVGRRIASRFPCTDHSMIHTFSVSIYIQVGSNRQAKAPCPRRYRTRLRFNPEEPRPNPRLRNPPGAVSR